MRRVVAETGRVVQVGTQQRSSECFQTAVELVRNGRIGQLKQVWVALPYFTTKGGPYPTTPVPKSLDWDPETEQIVGNDEASGWLKREQRKSHEVKA